MKIHQILLFGLVLSLLTFGLAGCQFGEKEKVEYGNQGIVIEQIQGAPPSQVSKGEEFPIMLTIENKGSYDVKPGEVKVFLEGIEPSLFSLTSDDLEKENTMELKKARRLEEISGGKEKIDFTDKAKYVGQNVDFTQPIKYVSCYNYETEVQANICFALEENIVCSLEGDKIKDALVGDAPVQITSITEERSGQNVLVKFKIENKGNGRVYAPEANCKIPEPFLTNSVEVSLETEEPFDCTPTLINAKSGEGRVNSIIACKRNMKDTANHLSPVKFKLRYKYIEVSDATIKVTE
ncbi:hypothetical protein B6U80_00020 [Candidatus Pacearchaeota archaeon ex4484_26]|nr:MAG: hypothetical protein B6U80_00020 [Candidatus Pacearchaeota archaeon ex4484_26]